ncbi:MAG: DMT family transporter [Eubacteriales bacterium]
MTDGILAGIMWALDTVILGIALQMTPFCKDAQAVFLAPFVSTFLHDAVSALCMWIYSLCKGSIGPVLRICGRRICAGIVLASAIGGPIGMTGYVLAVGNMGASAAAVASAVYPAVGAVLACVFLKEKMKPHQWVFLILTLVGVWGLSASPELQLRNIPLGLAGAFMCAFGWGTEAVILAKFLKNPLVKNEYVLQIRQTVSALCYGLILLPLLGGSRFTVSLFVSENGMVLPYIAAAALCGTVSYLYYYKAIAKVGAARAMALNITYTAWAIVFTVVIVGDDSVLNPVTVACAAAVVICGILAAADFRSLFFGSREGGRHDGTD